MTGAPAAGWSTRPWRPGRARSTVHDAGAGRRGHAGPARPGEHDDTLRARAATTTRSSAACTTRPPTSSARRSRRATRCGRGRSLHTRQHHRRAAPRHARPGQRVLRLQRRRGRHPAAARPGRRAGRLRRRRRPPRRRRREDLLGRPAGADDLPARDRPDALPRHRLPERRRRPGCARARRSTSRCPPGTSDAGWLRAFHAVVPPLLREFEPDVLVTQHGCDSHTRRPAGPPDADRRRPAGDVPRPPRRSPTRSPAAGGWPPAAAGTPWSRSCRGPGPTCWRSSAGAPLDPATETPQAWRELRRDPARPDRPAPADRRPHARVTATGAEGYDPDSLAGPRDPRHAVRGLPLHGLDPLP